MKKTLAIVLAAFMVFAIVACGSNAPANNTPANNTPANNPPANNTPANNTPANNAPVNNAPWNPDNIGNHRFVMAHGLAETSMTGQQYHQFAVAVDELSGGKMRVDERIGGTLVSDTESLDALLNGSIDFSHGFGPNYSGMMTDISPLTVAGYYGGDYESWRGFVDESRELLDSIYMENGIKYLGALAQGRSLIINIKHPVRVPSDVAGMTFRASGTWISKAVQAWGGAATTVSLADLPDAFSKGAVEGTATGLNVIVPFKLYEVCRYVTVAGWTETWGALVMAGSRWNSLNADEQALLLEAAKIFEDRCYDMSLDFMESYLKEIEDYGGCEIYVLSDSERQAFVKLSHTVYAEMEAELGPKGLELASMLKATVS